MATPNITLTGTLKDISGAADAGSLVITLVGYGANVPRISGTAVLAPVSLTIQAAGDGTFSTLLWGNDQIDVAGVTSTTWYSIEVKASDGSSLGVYAFQLTGSGSLDLSQLAQYNAQSVIAPPPNAVLTNPTGTQTITEFPLKVTELGIGQTEITSAATAARSVVLPDADGVVPQQLSAAAHQFLTGLGADGVFTKAQPAAADLSNGTTGTGAVVLANSPIINSPFTVHGSIQNFVIDANGGVQLGFLSGSPNVNGQTLGNCGIIQLNTSGNYAYLKASSSGSGAVAPLLLAGGATGTAGGVLEIQGATSGTTKIQPAAVASGTLTLPAATDTLVGQNTTDTLANKTLTNPKLSASSTIKDSSGAASMGVTMKVGTGGGDYSTASTTYVDVDGTNLAFTVTIPTGWKLLVHATGNVAILTAVDFVGISIFDGSTLIEQFVNLPSVNQQQPFSLQYVITGDGASHTVKLQYRTNSASHSAKVNNASSTNKPVMTFTLLPSN